MTTSTGPCGAIVAIRTIPPHGSPDYPALAVGIFAEALGGVTAVRFIRWVRRKPPESSSR